MLSKILDQIYDESDLFFDRFEIEIKKSVTRFLLRSFDVKANKIEISSKNLIIANSLQPEEKFTKKAFKTIRNFLFQILNSTFDRYKEYGKTNVDIKGFLQRFDNEVDNVLPDWYLLLRQRSVEAIAGGRSLSDIYDLVDGSEIGYKHFAAHIYASYQRDLSNQSRLNLGLQYAVYEGGTIKKTRDFCRSKDGKVFHTDEIASWTLDNWKGKSNPYNPFIHLGGYNCRHRLNWISDDLADYLLKN